MQTLSRQKTVGIRSEPMLHSEGPLAKAIEQVTAKLPSDTFLLLAGGAVLASLSLKVSGRDHQALFVGQWVAPFLVLGLYNKLLNAGA